MKKPECKHLNTGRTVRLASLIMSSDILDEHIINIFDQDGRFITKGNWYQDNVLAYTSRFGTAQKVGTGNAISFRLS